MILSDYWNCQLSWRRNFRWTVILSPIFIIFVSAFSSTWRSAFIFGCCSIPLEQIQFQWTRRSRQYWFQATSNSIYGKFILLAAFISDTMVLFPMLAFSPENGMGSPGAIYIPYCEEILLRYLNYSTRKNEILKSHGEHVCPSVRAIFHFDTTACDATKKKHTPLTHYWEWMMGNYSIMNMCSTEISLHFQCYLRLNHIFVWDHVRSCILWFISWCSGRI